MSRRAHSSRSQRSRSGSTTGVSPQTRAIASRVRSSGVGPSPPVLTTRSARSERSGERLGDDLEPVGQGRDPADGHAGIGQRARQLAGVGVARLADGQLRSDAEQLRGHDAAVRAGARHDRQRNGPARCPGPAVAGRHPGAAIIAVRPRCSPGGPPESATEHDPGQTVVPIPPAQAQAAGPARPAPRRPVDAALGLAMAHIELAKAEAAAIGGEIAKVAAYVGIAIAVVLLAVILLVVGSSLFFGGMAAGLDRLGRPARRAAVHRDRHRLRAGGGRDERDADRPVGPGRGSPSASSSR